MSGSYKLEGLEQLQKNINKRIANVQNASPRAFTDVVVDLLGKSVRLAPVDQGDLRGSGSADVNGNTVAKGSSDGSTSAGGFPGPSTGGKNTGKITFSEPYAVVQHEELSYVHPKGGQAKYLEQPLAENADKYVDHIAGKLGEAVEKS